MMHKLKGGIFQNRKITESQKIKQPKEIPNLQLIALSVLNSTFKR